MLEERRGEETQRSIAVMKLEKGAGNDPLPHALGAFRTYPHLGSPLTRGFEPGTSENGAAMLAVVDAGEHGFVVAVDGVPLGHYSA